MSWQISRCRAWDSCSGIGSRRLRCRSRRRRWPSSVSSTTAPTVSGDRLGPLIAAIVDPRVHTDGLRVDGEWACVALTLRLGDDVSVHYVATEAGYRRRGLAARVVGSALAQARANGMRAATLQASPDGHGVYERLGFRTVATLRASTTPP